MSKCRGKRQPKGTSTSPCPVTGKELSSKGTENVPIWQEGTDGRLQLRLERKAAMHLWELYRDWK